MHPRRPRSPGLATLSLLCALGTACGGAVGSSPAAPAGTEAAAAAPSSGGAAAPSRGSSGAVTTPALRASALLGELRAAGLRPEALPKFDALSPEQLRKVMGLMTRSLGVDCKFCHEPGNFKKATPHKRVAERMWDEWVVGHTVSIDGVAQPVFCDSCHQGKAEYLGRGDHEALVGYMKEQLVARVQREGAALECTSCHGAPFRPHFLDEWAR